MTINRSLSYERSKVLASLPPLMGIKWDPSFRIFYPTPSTPSTYAERTRELASRFSCWVWVSPSEVEVVP
jgi:hypothetical protein